MQKVHIRLLFDADFCEKDHKSYKFIKVCIKII